MSVCRVDEEFKYQAVIFYGESPDEDQFIQGELLVYLENTWKYKTYVEQRDNLIGAGQQALQYNIHVVHDVVLKL